MSIENRISSNQPDFLLVIVERPAGWRPKNYFEVPPYGKVVSSHVVASYSEAHDDLERCNRFSLTQSLDTWAIIRPAKVP